MKNFSTLILALIIGSGLQAQTAPTVAAPTPTYPAGGVISMFSNAYTDVSVDTWLTVWSAGQLTDTTIAGNDTKKYSSLDFIGIETVTNQIDATGMNSFHFDAWTPNNTQIRVKLVDFGADAAFGGGDDTEHEIVFASPAQSSWIEYDISITDFVGLTNRNNISQLIFAGQPAGSGILFLDNIYFSDEVINTPPPSLAQPTVAAPTPTDAAGDVISMFSDAYTDVPVDTWQTVWSQAVLTDTAIAGNATKRYDALDFVGIETVTTTIDASGMNSFHFDVWSPNFADIRVKLVDFGADGAFGGGDDSEHEIAYAAPGLETWLEFDIPISDFAGLNGRSSIGQLIFAAAPAGTTTLYLDNVYFSFQAGLTGPAQPMVAAPTPTDAPADVVSMYSDAYTDVPVDTWQTVWSQGVLTDTTIAGNPTKRYDGLNFVGIEATTSPVDASAMNTFHFNAWTPANTEIRVKLVDFGADGAFGGGDDSEHEITYASPAIETWIQYDIPLANFVGLTGSGAIGQLIFAGQPAGAGILYLDNIYFSTQVIVPSAPTVAAPTPTEPSSGVISMFSDAYTDVLVDTWQTVWSSGNLTDLTVAGNPTKLYENLDFVGIETVTNLIDASNMTTFHFDAWTPDMTELRVKLVDFGADGMFGGGDDTEHEVVFSAPAQGSWIEYDIPLSAFTGLVNRNNIAQLIFSGNPAGTGSVYIDNVYFSDAPVAENTLSMKAFLQGPMNFTTGLMDDDLRSLSLIPSSDPYPALGFTYSGAGWSDNFDSNVLTATGNDAIVDWVIVDMIPDASVGGNTAAAYSRPALIQRDGDIVNLDGSSPVSLNMPAGTYFAAVRHRNHLGVIQTSSAVYGAGSVSVDFTSTAGASVNAEAMNVNGSSRALWSGDVNFDQAIKYTGSSNDRDPILVIIGGSIPTNTTAGYLGEDVNMDGIVKYTGSSNDRDIILQNIGGSVPTNVRVQVGF